MAIVHETGLPVELYLRDRLLLGQWAPRHARLLDALESDRCLVLRRARAVSLGGGPSEVLGAAIVPAAAILLAIPPGPHLRPAPAALWRPRRRLLARAHLGSLTVMGTFHLDTGTTVDAPTTGRGTFLAVTETLVSWSDEPGSGEPSPLVLVASAAIDAWFPVLAALATR